MDDIPEPRSAILELRLRDVRASDLPVLYEHQLDEEANRMVGFSPRDRDAFDAHWKKILADDAVTKQTIVVDDEVVGYLVAFEQAGKREVGYWIGRAFWGRGVASAALVRFLEHETARPLYGVVTVHNAASRRVLEKCGFELAGRLEAGVGVGPGASVDQLVLRLR